MLHVLIIEDEPAYVDALEVSLAREGFAVTSAGDGRDGLAAFRSSNPDLVLLDLMLPGMSGLDVLRRIRTETEVPVLVLSAKDGESDVVAALELGADDYLTKPYSVRELIARIHVAIRRSASAADDDDGVLAAGNTVLDPSRYQLRVDNAEFDLPRKEFEVMRKLIRRPGRIVTRDELLVDIWGYGVSDSKTLDQHIRRLRRKLEQADATPEITTVRGVGYRLDP